MLTEKLYRTYKQTEDKNPRRDGVCRKERRLHLFRRYGRRTYGVIEPVAVVFRGGRKGSKTLTIGRDALSGICASFMNAGLKIALFDEPEEEKRLIDESDKSPPCR